LHPVETGRREINGQVSKAGRFKLYREAQAMKDVLIVTYSSNRYDAAIDAELARLGIDESDFRCIIAMPESMKKKSQK
jgi:hypothetical protein